MRELLVISIFIAACSPSTADNAPPSESAAVVASAQLATDTITVYKTPTCGCCANWVDHVRKHGYHVVAIDQNDLTDVKRRLGVPQQLSACHTATVGGYVVEGHVPAPDIARLLSERPAVAGIAVPGMPMGSPGMEGLYSERYEVVTFDKAGATKVFASH
ncbi:MAG TPA: DUF411 domain-containing protein [Gemmatimonadaceae bacterium]|nr:DUF411 domain-containing protein [Gemmatimonadaceae bacterium]